jgi:hypothetical protein
VEGKDFYLGDLLLMNDQWNCKSREQLKELVKNGPMPQQGSFDFTGDYFVNYIKVMKNSSLSGVSQLVSKEISRLPEFPGMRKMIDLGGAHGMDCIAMVMKNSALSGIVFDKPAVVKVTQEIIAEYEMEERITVMGGDYAVDSIGSGYDLVYAKATLNFLKDNLTPLFKKIYEALNPGGVFVSVQDGLTNEGTEPEDMVISWLSTGLSSGDLSLCREAIPNALIDAGFKTVQTKPIYCHIGGIWDMTIGRK